MDNQKLIDLAALAQKNSYAPYSKVNVGAALLSRDGRVFSGCNVENSSYGATICAERCAILKAVSEGVQEFEAIAVTSNLKDFAYPCGMCLQVMAEFNPELRVVVVNGAKEVAEFGLKELLPKMFGLGE